MKKSIFLIAAMAGALFTACTSEENLTLDNPGKQASANVAVGFDTYLSQNTQTQTRAGQQNVMTNAKLQKTQANLGGFGVMAVQHNASDPNERTEVSTNNFVGNWAAALASTASVAPDFMWNQGVFYSASAWGYTPLKYWPNETNNDSQSDPAISQTQTVTEVRTHDKVSFFAYAPYVNFKASEGGKTVGTNTSITSAVKNYTIDGSSYVDAGSETPTAQKGIMAITDYATADQSPKVYYTVNANGTEGARRPEESVDLLWGVAPAGGLNYTAVNKEAVSIPEGMPLLDLQKPGENEKVKFSFQHALSRISLSIVAALDQIGPGGEFEGGPKTKINVAEVNVRGKFNTSGWLDLNNNKKNRALWVSRPIAPGYGTDIQDAGTNWLFKMSNATILSEAGSGPGTTGNSLLNETIWDLGGNTAAQTEGVLTSEKPVMAPILDTDKPAASATPAFESGKSYYKETDSHINSAVEATVTYTTTSANEFYIKDAAGKFVGQPTSTAVTLKGSTSSLYTTVTEASNFASGASISAGTYYKKSGATEFTYTPVTLAGPTNDTGETIYTLTVKEDNDWAAKNLTYTSGTYYEGILPRYWMVIPAYYDESAGTVQNTDVTVQIKYYVTTDDANLNGGYSRVENIIEKTVPVAFECGKSYNLKLILGLTSVKLNAEVADWKLAGDTEVNLPQNVE